MEFKTISETLVQRMDMVNHRSKNENEVIQYGLELIIETIFKLILLLILGFIIGKGLETMTVLITFCGLRSLAGGKHASTNIGCTLCMILVWGVSLGGYLYINITNIALGYIYMISMAIVIFRVPQTSNIEHFSRKMIFRIKLKVLLLITFFIYISYLEANIRGLLVYPVILEVISLLPVNKINVRRKELYERTINNEDSRRGD